jgi:hypothetical protein
MVVRCRQALGFQSGLQCYQPPADIERIVKTPGEAVNALLHAVNPLKCAPRPRPSIGVLTCPPKPDGTVFVPWYNALSLYRAASKPIELVRLVASVDH